MAGKIRPKPIPRQNGPMTAKLFGQFIRARRTQVGLRIDDAAMLCGVSVETLSKIETAKSGVRFENALIVANKLGVQICIKQWDENGQEDA